MSPHVIFMARRGHQWYFHGPVPHALHLFAAPSPIRGDNRVRSLSLSSHSLSQSRISLSPAAAGTTVGINRNQLLAFLSVSLPLPHSSSFSTIARRGSASLGLLSPPQVRASASSGGAEAAAHASAPSWTAAGAGSVDAASNNGSGRIGPAAGG